MFLPRASKVDTVWKPPDVVILRKLPKVVKNGAKPVVQNAFIPPFLKTAKIANGGDQKWYYV